MKLTQQTYEAVVATLLARINKVYVKDAKHYSKPELQSALREIDNFRLSGNTTN